MSPDEASPGNGLLLFFRIDDFDMALKRARALVARFEEEPHVNPNTQTREFSLRDPDGYYVTISALPCAPEKGAREAARCFKTQNYRWGYGRFLSRALDSRRAKGTARAAHDRIKKDSREMDDRPRTPFLSNQRLNAHLRMTPSNENIAVVHRRYESNDSPQI
jgi:hypothetical protein